MGMTTSTQPPVEVHLPSLLREIGNNSRDVAIFRTPLRIAGGILFELGVAAAHINALMCRLAIYSCADPYSPDYDKKLADSIVEEAQELKRLEAANERASTLPNHKPSTIGTQ